jgi:hypothetical protein
LQKLRKKLTVHKQAAHKLDVEKFNLRNRREREVWEQHQIKISNKFAALEKLNDSEDINKTWENIKENTKTSAKTQSGSVGHEMKQHKPWCVEEYARLLD